MGVLFSTLSKNLVPIHDGKLQIQHTTKIPEAIIPATKTKDEDMLYLCAFSPRASHVCISPNEEERPTNMERKVSLDVALGRISISWEDLLSERYAGTPPARIYRSFVAPRPNAVHILEPVERAANRTAAQIELALRQLRADEAAYLRNTDRASPALTSVPNDRVVNPVVLLLDNIRSAFNVGSMFRTGETAGVAEIVTCGITAHPPHPKLRKTAFSAVDTVPSRHFDDVISAIRQLKEEGYTIIAMETTSRSKLYTEIEYPAKCVLVVGNEVTGVDTRVMEEADIIAEIPTYGVKNSLNVASAAPIVLFEVLRQWQARSIIGTGKVADASLVQREME
jgi:tRNA G18 (ribose-2'-O)-methylase SpoU